MKKYDGKKILFLGSNAGTVDLVNYARSNGARVFVADYYNVDRSPAKAIADESLQLSTADLDALETVVRENNIDCVYSGISEFNLLQSMKLSERCELPFYCTERQWASIAEKDQFRKLCKKHFVPCPTTYYVGSSMPDSLADSLKYPVVVKPVDGSSSVGVSICGNAHVLRDGIGKALDASPSNKIIIEQFVSGCEFTAHYTIFKGKASLSCIDNRYPVAIHEGSVTTIPIARIYPSLFIDEYVDKVDPQMVSLCEDLGIEYGVLFVQGLFDPDIGEFAVFEAGLRSAGECPFKLIEKVNGRNYATMILDSMLGRAPSDEEWVDDPYLGGKSCGVVSYVAKHGVVGEIEGLEKALSSIPGIIDHELRYPVGSETPDTDTLRQLMLRFYMVCDSRSDLSDAVRQINETVEVFDTEGEDLVLKFDPARLSAMI